MTRKSRKTALTWAAIVGAAVLTVILFNQPVVQKPMVEPQGYREVQEIKELFSETKKSVDNKKLTASSSAKDGGMDTKSSIPDFTIAKLDSFDETLGNVLNKQREIANSTNSTIQTANQSMAGWALPDPEEFIPKLDPIPKLNVAMLSSADMKMPAIPRLLNIPDVTYPNLFEKHSLR